MCVFSFSFLLLTCILPSLTLKLAWCRLVQTNFLSLFVRRICVRFCECVCAIVCLILFGCWSEENETINILKINIICRNKVLWTRHIHTDTHTTHKHHTQIRGHNLKSNGRERVDSVRHFDRSNALNLCVGNMCLCTFHRFPLNEDEEREHSREPSIVWCLI